MTRVLPLDPIIRHVTTWIDVTSTWRRCQRAAAMRLRRIHLTSKPMNIWGFHQQTIGYNRDIYIIYIYRDRVFIMFIMGLIMVSWDVYYGMCNGAYNGIQNWQTWFRRVSMVNDIEMLARDSCDPHCSCSWRASISSNFQIFTSGLKFLEERCIWRLWLSIVILKYNCIYLYVHLSR